MAKKSKTTKTADLMASTAITTNPEAEAGLPVVIDHHSQGASWDVSGAESELAKQAMEDAANAFDDLTAQIDQQDVDTMVNRISAAVTEREDYERSKDAENGSIQSTLKKVRQAFVTKGSARVMLACSVEPDFINRSLQSEGKMKFNVYSLGKAADLMTAIRTGVMANAINIAVMRSLFQCRAAGVPFTGEMAKGAASKQYRRIDPAVAKHLVRYTVSESTAPTQASSTMQALTTLGIVKATGTTRAPVYELTDHPVVKVLEEALAKAA